MKYLVALLMLLALGLLYVRFAPSDPVLWHGDPLTAEAATRGGWLVRPVDGNAAGDVFVTRPATLLAAFDRVATATPRTQRLAGGVNEGRVTYVSRSAWIGFPDYTTVTAVPVPGGVALAVHARQRFGSDDFGMNRARIDRWQREVRALLEEQGVALRP